jgi:hypothetical protein
MAGMDWFRWHHGSVTDPKFQLVAKKAGVKAAEVVAVWAFLLEEASQAEDRGNPGAIDFESIDCLLGLDEGKAREVYRRMVERGLFAQDGRIEAWERRQPKREREDDTAAERKRRQRANEATTTVTPCHAMSRQTKPEPDESHQKTPRGEESREEDSVPKGTGDTAGPDPIFGDGLSYLMKTGVPEKGARSFLGKMRKALNDDLVAVELLVKAQQLEVSDPVPWLRAAAQKRLSTGRTSAGVAL